MDELAKAANADPGIPTYIVPLTAVRHSFLRSPW
jgi:hypothetical protein